MLRSELPHCQGCGGANAAGLNHCTPLTTSCDPDCRPSAIFPPATESARPPHQPMMLEGTVKLTETGGPVLYVVMPEIDQPPAIASSARFPIANFRPRPKGRS